VQPKTIPIQPFLKGKSPDVWKAQKRGRHNEPEIHPHCHPNNEPACGKCGCINIFITHDQKPVTHDGKKMDVFWYNCSYCRAQDIICVNCALLLRDLTPHEGLFPIIFEGYEIQLEALLHVVQ